MNSDIQDIMRLNAVGLSLGNLRTNISIAQFNLIKILEETKSSRSENSNLPYFLSEECQEEYRLKVNLAKMEASQRANGIGYHVDIIRSKLESKKSNKWQTISISLAALATAGAIMVGYSNIGKVARDAELIEMPGIQNLTRLYNQEYQNLTQNSSEKRAFINQVWWVNEGNIRSVGCEEVESIDGGALYIPDVNCDGHIGMPH